ncbi:hypothetical protein M5689_011411 [Euphorbia peplus]|nr:hypothetical protein M5689_011411 [Euphorbia peplus]
MNFMKRQNSSYRETIYLGQVQKDHQVEIKSKWRFLKFWKREKHMRIFNNGYDEDEYSKNFDQGSGWAEPDNLSRSFSARFSDPSSSSSFFIRNSSVRYVRGI